MEVTGVCVCVCVRLKAKCQKKFHERVRVTEDQIRVPKASGKDVPCSKGDINYKEEEKCFIL